MLDGEPSSRVTVALSETPGWICSSADFSGRLPRWSIGIEHAPNANARAARAGRQSRQDGVMTGQEYMRIYPAKLARIAGISKELAGRRAVSACRHGRHAIDKQRRHANLPAHSFPPRDSQLCLPPSTAAESAVAPRSRPTR